MGPAEIGKIIAVDIPVVGDAKQALEMLLAEPVVKTTLKNGLKKVTKDKERKSVLTTRKERWYNLRQLSNVSVNRSRVMLLWLLTLVNIVDCSVLSIPK